MILASSQLLWYTTRATGVVALVLLTGSVVLGVLTSVRFDTPLWPRFALQDLHKRVSLLSVLFVSLHIVTTVSDSYAPIGWISVFVPFTSPYRRLWLGLGTVSVDLLIAVTISSLLRHRMNPGTWRALHWLTYASWPLALVHGLGTGTDPHLTWMVALTVASVAAVVVAVGWRLVAGWPNRARARLVAGATSAMGVVALAAWTAGGPLRPGWAARAGTPSSLLTSTRQATVTQGRGSGAATSPSTTRPVPSLPVPPYSASFTGSITQNSASGGNEQLEIKAQTSGALQAQLDIVIVGNPDPSGGVTMQTSEARFGPISSPGQYQGSIVGLDGSRMLLAMHDPTGASSLYLRVDVSISGAEVTGQLRSTLVAAGGAVGDDN